MNTIGINSNSWTAAYIFNSYNVSNLPVILLKTMGMDVSLPLNIYTYYPNYPLFIASKHHSELLSLPEHLSSTKVFSGIHETQSFFSLCSVLYIIVLFLADCPSIYGLPLWYLQIFLQLENYYIVFKYKFRSHCIAIRK